jgi:lysophospholipase L1-like esterase
MSNYNKQVAAAAKRNGAMFVDCNKGVANIKSKTLYRDGTHLAPAGQK